MKYIVCESPGHFVLRENGSQPLVTDENALLKVKRVGICGTDLHAFKGNQPFFSYPRILGHELATEIVEIGPNPQGLKVGDRVVLIPYINCNDCVACRAGKSNCCQNLRVYGVHTDGGMQETISFPTRLLIPANELSLDEIVLVEPLAIGAHALRRAKVKKGQTIVVIGCGPIGIGIIQLAKYIGATVIAIDINDHRLQTAKEQFSADITFNAEQSSVDEVRKFTNGELAGYVFDATGSKYAIESGVNYMQHGGTFVLVGLFKGELSFQHPQIHAKETTLLCSRNATRDDFVFVMKVLSESKFNTNAYVTKTVNCEAVLTEFNAWARPESKELKVVTVWG